MRARYATLAALLIALSGSRVLADAPVPLSSGVAAASSQGKPATAPATRPSSAFTDESAPLPADPGDHKLRFHTTVGKTRVDMAVLLHLPPGYRSRDAADSSPPAPMILFMHGGGECGSDCAAIYTNGPMTMLRKSDRDPRFAASFPFVLLAPQCPPRGQRWDQEPMTKAVVALLNDFLPRANVDPDRVYITGLSMGGVGTWRVAYAAADKFAAVAPMSAVSYKPNDTAARLWHDSIFGVVGADDSDQFVGGTHQMNNAMANSPAEVRFTYLVGNGHDAWWPTYASPQFYEWLLAQRRGAGNGGAPAPAAATTQPDAALATTDPPTTQPVATMRSSSPIPQQPGHYRLVFNTTVGVQPYQMDYLLYLPRDYRPAGGAPAAEARPAMLFLHEERAIGADIAGLCPHGPDLELERPGSNLASSFPMVVISPRLPIKCDWYTPGMNQALLALLDHVQESLNVDRSRISISGIDEGAVEAMGLAAAAPDRFAAVVPVMNDGALEVPSEQVKPLATLAGWAQLRPWPQGTYNRFKSLVDTGRLPWRLETLSSLTTPASPVDSSIYADHAFLGWLQQQRRSGTPARSASTD